MAAKKSPANGGNNEGIPRMARKVMEVEQPATRGSPAQAKRSAAKPAKSGPTGVQTNSPAEGTNEQGNKKAKAK